MPGKIPDLEDSIDVELDVESIFRTAQGTIPETTLGAILGSTPGIVRGTRPGTSSFQVF